MLKEQLRETFVMFDTVVLAVGGKTWLFVLFTLLELVPVWPTVLYGVVFKHV